MHQHSGSSFRPPDALHPASPTSPPQISNRHWMRLEIAVTHTKHSPDPISNRHKNTVVPTVRTGAPARARSALDCGCSATALPIPAPPPSAHAPSGRDRAHAWGRHSCVRNVADPSTNCARTALASLGSTPSSRGPFTGRRISLRFLSASPRTLLANPVSPHSPLSNRSDPRLEMPESYRKQTTAPLSNRHKFTHRSSRSVMSKLSRNSPVSVKVGAFPRTPASEDANMARVATARGAHGVMLGIGALLVLAALGNTPPAFAQTQPTPPQSSAPAANSPPPAQASAQVPPAPPVAPASERYTTNEDYATERLAAVKLHQMKEMLKALPLLEDLYAKNQHDDLVLEYLTTALLARSATQTDPALATKDTVRAKAMIDRARALGDQSQLAENLSESLKNVTEKSTLSFSSKADVEAAMKAGEAAFAKNDFDEAIKDYKHAVELDPSNYFATLFVGDAYFSKKDFVPAGEWYTKAQVLDPDIETAFRYHADMLAKQGDYAGARKLCFEAIVASPYESKTWRQLVEWGKVAHVTPQRVHIETGGSVTPTDKGANITLDASQPVDVSAVWFAYNGTRALWRE